ncbi:response regulator [Candidatus Dojkabacteria bacterium]|nr:response regulator [Candidatus Dojkabacteria bacterium]
MYKNTVKRLLNFPKRAYKSMLTLVGNTLTSRKRFPEQNILTVIQERKIKVVATTIQCALIIATMIMTIGAGNQLFSRVSLLFTALLLGLSTISVLSIRKGHYNFSKYFSPGFMLIGASYLNYHFGPYIPATMGFTLAVLFAAMLLSKTEAVIFTVLLIILNALTFRLHTLSHYAAQHTNTFPLQLLLLNCTLFYPTIVTLVSFSEDLLTNSLKKITRQSIKLKKEIVNHKKTLRALRQTSKFLEKSRKDEENLFANMNHQLRTPITAITGISELLADTDLTSVQENYVRNLITSSNSLSDLVNDILDFSKARSTEIEVYEEIFTFQSIFDKVLQILSLKAVENNNVIETHLDCDTKIPLKGDSQKITQILSNLLDNSIKFTRNGKIKLSTQLLEQRNDKVKVKVTVSDNGIGIAKKDIARVFETYQSVNPHSQGTGLGLAIVKQLTKLLSGQVNIESKLKKGTTVSLILPLKLASKNEKLPTNAGPKLGSIRTSDKMITIKKNLSRLRVLLIEDDDLNRLVITELLKKYAIQPITAKCGNEAVNLLKKGKFNLLITDLNLPGKLAGIELIETAKELKPNLKIIVISAFSDEKVIQKAFSAGADAYAVKPFNNDQILSTIYNVLGK